jgi:AcrR family transcriptional regulator
VNVATLSYHFGGKEALHDAVLEAAHDELTEFTVPSELPDTPEQRVRVVVAALYHFARTRRGALRLLLRTTLREGALPEPLRERQTADGMAKARDLLVALNLPPHARIDRLALLSINHLVARYAISAERAVAPFVVETDVEEEVARHLGDVAVALLLHH